MSEASALKASQLVCGRDQSLISASDELAITAGATGFISAAHQLMSSRAEACFLLPMHFKAPNGLLASVSLPAARFTYRTSGIRQAGKQPHKANLNPWQVKSDPWAGGSPYPHLLDEQNYLQYCSLMLLSLEGYVNTASFFASHRICRE